MTLKEKFKVLNCTDCNMPYCDTKCTILSTRELETLEKIADDFSIGFAEWSSYKYKYLSNKGWFATTYQLEMGIFKTSKELLEMYKKEKSLLL
jgi:hypothetical protein